MDGALGHYDVAVQNGMSRRQGAGPEAAQQPMVAEGPMRVDRTTTPNQHIPLTLPPMMPRSPAPPCAKVHRAVTAPAAGASYQSPQFYDPEAKISQNPTDSVLKSLLLMEGGIVRKRSSSTALSPLSSSPPDARGDKLRRTAEPAASEILRRRLLGIKDEPFNPIPASQQAPISKMEDPAGTGTASSPSVGQTFSLPVATVTSQEANAGQQEQNEDDFDEVARVASAAEALASFNARGSRTPQPISRLDVVLDPDHGCEGDQEEKALDLTEVRRKEVEAPESGRMEQQQQQNPRSHLASQYPFPTPVKCPTYARTSVLKHLLYRYNSSNGLNNNSEEFGEDRNVSPRQQL